jgi:hypothetical protein
MFFAGGKWNAQSDNVSRAELVDAAGGNKGPAEAYILDAAGICFVFVGKNDFDTIHSSFVDSFIPQIISHDRDDILPGRIGLSALNPLIGHSD